MDQIFDQSDLLLERLMAAIGKGNASAAERQQLEVTLPLMRKLYEHRVRHITTTEPGCETIDTKRELLQKLLVKHAEIRELRNQLGKRKRDIAWGAYCCMAKGEISEADFFNMTSPANAEGMGEIEALSIQHLLEL